MPLIRNTVASRTALVAGGALLALAIATLADFEGVSVASSAAKAAAPSSRPPAPPQNGIAGFVVSSIDWATGPDATKDTCPSGMTTMAQLYVTGNNPGARASSAQRAAACEFPEKIGPDPLHRVVAGTNTKVAGLNLDGRDSHQSKAGTCSHDNFQGANGEAGVDNQFYRAVGCSPGWQASGGKRLFGQEMLTGAWGILISLRGVDSLVNDKDVQVGIYANADPIQLSSARNPLIHATYNPDQDPRFRAETRGQIVNGVLTTNAVNVRFHSITNSIRLERPMDMARLRLTVMPDGSLDGVLAGYAKVDDLYDFVVGYRNGKDGKGAPSRNRFGSAGGSAGSAGISCNGLYFAMKQLADGERDPKTGACNAISHAYRIKAIPAFVRENPAVVANAARTR